MGKKQKNKTKILVYLSNKTPIFRIYDSNKNPNKSINKWENKLNRDLSKGQILKTWKNVQQSLAIKVMNLRFHSAPVRTDNLQGNNSAKKGHTEKGLLLQWRKCKSVHPWLPPVWNSPQQPSRTDIASSYSGLLWEADGVRRNGWKITGQYAP